MKKYKIAFALLAAVLLGAGLWKWLNYVPEDGPPTLVVTCGEQEITAWRGSYSWHRLTKLKHRMGAVADSPHPLDVMEELPVLSARPGDRMELTFQAEKKSLFEAEPWEVHVMAYSAQEADDPFNAEGTEVPLQDGTLILPDEGRDMVYLVDGFWSVSGMGGGCVDWAFYVP